MARREWAEQWAFDASEGDTAQIRMTVAAKRLQSEHALAVRIVKADINSAKRDRHNYSTATRHAIVARLERLLAALQKGR